MAREILTDADVCRLADRWQVTVDTMERVVAAANQFRLETGRDVHIISGFRTAAQQRELAQGGRPAAPDHLSTHRSCPATGVDVSLGPGATRPMIATWGRIAVMAGLRWGGGGAVDSGGVPVDWNHVDRGPRRG